MTRKPDAASMRKPIALAALKRAAKYALDSARQTKTPCWVLEGDKLVDATQTPEKKLTPKRAARRAKK